MKNGLRTLRQQQNLVLWSKQVEDCNNSGLSVAEWCREKKFPLALTGADRRKLGKHIQIILKIDLLR